MLQDIRQSLECVGLISLMIDNRIGQQFTIADWAYKTAEERCVTELSRCDLLLFQISNLADECLE